MSSQPQTINSNKHSNESGFDFPLSPTEPGKFDFYRVHLNNQPNKNDSMYSDHYEVSSEIPKHWSSTPFAHMKHLSEKPKTASLTSLFKSSDSDSIPTTNTLNKPIQTVASFSSLTDAIKNAMQRGTIKIAADPLHRPPTNRSTVSSKDLNHLSPQSM